MDPTVGLVLFLVALMGLSAIGLTKPVTDFFDREGRHRYNWAAIDQFWGELPWSGIGMALIVVLAFFLGRGSAP